MMRPGTGGVALRRIAGVGPRLLQPPACLGPHGQEVGAGRCLTRALGVATALSALLSSGCLSSNTYNEPRALPARELSVGVAPELYRAHAVREAPGTAFPRRTVDAHGYSVVPSTAFVRVGLGKGFEVGGRVNGASVAGAEGKLEFARGRFDVAIGPSVQVGRESYVIADVPLLLGWNVGDAVIVLTPAFDYAKNAPTPSSSKSTLPFPEGALGKVTLGVRVKPPGSLAIQPEVSALRSFRDPASTLVTVGIAFLYHGGHADEGSP